MNMSVGTYPSAQNSLPNNVTSFLASANTKAVSKTNKKQAPAIFKTEAEKAAFQTVVNFKRYGGSGVIIGRQGNKYQLITNWHVAANTFLVNDRRSHDTYRKIGDKLDIILPNGKIVQATLVAWSTKGEDYQQCFDNGYLPNPDLAVLEFTSEVPLPVARLAMPKTNEKVFSIGYPSSFFPMLSAKDNIFYDKSKGVSIARGSVLNIYSGNQSKPSGDYGVITSNVIQGGMSGGGFFNEKGELIAINGRSNLRMDLDQFFGKKGASAGISTEEIQQFFKQNKLKLWSASENPGAKNLKSAPAEKPFMPFGGNFGITSTIPSSDATSIDFDTLWTRAANESLTTGQQLTHAEAILKKELKENPKLAIDARDIKTGNLASFKAMLLRLTQENPQARIQITETGKTQRTDGHGNALAVYIPPHDVVTTFYQGKSTQESIPRPTMNGLINEGDLYQLLQNTEIRRTVQLNK